MALGCGMFLYCKRGVIFAFGKIFRSGCLSTVGAVAIGFVPGGECSYSALVPRALLQS